MAVALITINPDPCPRCGFKRARTRQNADPPNATKWVVECVQCTSVYQSNNQ